MTLSIGLLVNPVAGLGGAVALKGSDGVVAEALRRGAEPRAAQRAQRALEAAGAAAQRCRWLTWDAPMGADVLAACGIDAQVLGRPDEPTTALATQVAARRLAEAGVDLLVFAGGDGTARDVLAAVAGRLPVLGIPAGVKMHSGVFATTPELAGELLVRLIEGGLVQSVEREVRDMDEAALREGVLKPRYYGTLRVPERGGYLQHTKEAGRESEALAVEEIVAEVVERLGEVQRPVALGPGSTVRAVKQALGITPTLLGFDVWQGTAEPALDVDARWLTSHAPDAIVVLSFTRGQGFLLGRGNQQLSPAFLAGLDPADLWIVGTRTKLASLDGRALLVDTDDPALDVRFSGLHEIIAGYEDRLLYRIGRHA